MKTIIIILISCIATALYSASPGWVWMNGDGAANTPGVYGVQGVANAANMPPGLYEAMEWKDLNGNFWLYGGLQLTGGSAVLYSDLWKFDPTPGSSTYNQWTWVKGPGAPVAQTPVYGTKGVANSNNTPGARAWGALTWVDKAGDFWLFGGSNFDMSGVFLYNDLWKYNIASNNWTWMNGPNTPNDPGDEGTIGVPSVNNVPQSRSETSVSWTDTIGNLWLYGGSSEDGAYLDDLWKYDLDQNSPSFHQWTCMTVGAKVYGTEGVSDPANRPGGRWAYSKWIDNANNLWLFSGQCDDINDPCNDLWKYDIAVNEWTWVSSATGANGSCSPSVNNGPDSRMEGRACWKDGCGNFWLFSGANSADLWNYNVLNNEWTLAKDGPSYGIKGIADPANIPKIRSGALPWTDNDGNLWLFGGEVLGVCQNDLWKYVIDPNCPAINAVSGFIADTLAGCSPLNINFANKSVNASSFFWDFGDGQNDSGSDPTHTYSAGGIYTVSLTAKGDASCKTSENTSTKTITVENCETKIPNIITPNGDGKNDYFVIEGIESFPQNKLMIYNRWGRIIKEISAYQNSWQADGTPDGVYYYTLSFSENSRSSQNGFITICR